MKFEKYGKINPTKQYSINPLNHLDNSKFKRLNFLLDSIEKKSPRIYQKYINQLIDTFNNLVKEKEKIIDNLIFNEIVEKYPHLKDQKILTKLYFNYLAETINLSNEDITLTTEIKIPSKIFWQIGFGILYYEALVLTKVMNRNEAIELFKKYLDQYYVFIESTFTKYKTLDELRNEHLKDARESTDAEFLSTYSTVEDGRYIIRNENCPAVEALDEYQDKELVYLVCCYADFQYAKVTNENFRMTRFYTIAENDPYCDKVFHDIRKSKGQEHPSTELIDSMGPLSKEHWRKDYFKK